MTTHRGVFRTVVGSIGLLIGLILLMWPTGILQADMVVSLAWDANTEPDLAGYKIHYGTSSGRYTLGTTNVVGRVNTGSIPNLQANTTYYFVVTAYDLAGNESQPSNEVAVQPTSTTLPTIDGALELGTQSVYILQSGNQTIQVNGTNFQRGATMGLGTDVSVGSTSLLDSSHLTASIIVNGSAILGPRSLRVTNPDGGMASRANALTIVKTADINRDCKIDLVDLNLLARAWNTLSSESAYIVGADLDGDGDVGGLDLDVFVSYLGQRLAVCP